ncbi:MAG TPA: thiamine phosphate synthase [Terriglobales bacterium]|nr:thiamine phosphate synthase [Terriglobales bacterium]
MLLYYITDRKAFPGSEQEQRKALLGKIGEAARAGIDLIQLREKDLTARELEGLAGEAVRAVRDNSAATKLLINSRTDIALACHADGVHLPAGDLPASEVRALWMKCSNCQPVIGVSAHSVNDVRLAHSHGADFVVIAPIFEKIQSSERPLGVDALRTACSELRGSGSFPVLALGGVTLKNAGACVAAGASGVAGIRLFQTGTLHDTVQRLRALEAREIAR